MDKSENQLPQAVIFDMDGVMVDTEPIYFASNQALFNRLGFSVTSVDYAQFIGLDAARMWTELKSRHDLPHPVKELVRMETDGMVTGLQSTDLAPMPGLHDLINRLDRAGYQLGLASSSTHQVIRVILKKLDLTDRFRAVVSGEDVENGKPAPDIFLHTAARLAVSPASCLVIEDSANGVRGAAAAGMRVIGFRNPSSGAQDLSAADEMVDDLGQIELKW